ncbi:MAG: serine protease [Pseudomonadota bacterium]|nr:serine protease [Pseudomonadota bacterium]
MKHILLLASLSLSCTPLLAASPEDVYRHASPAVALVVALGNKTSSQGSGVIIATNVVATNCHVIQGASTIAVMSGTQKTIARTIYTDSKRDVCLLSVGIAGGLPATLSSASDLRVGQRVYAIGAPRGLNLSLSEGIVSSLRGDDTAKLVQTTAQISPGSSGGGLFDDQGRLVGLTTFKIHNGEGLNFALPSEWLAEALTAINKRNSTNRTLAASKPERDESVTSLALLTATSLNEGGCPFDQPPELPPKNSARIDNYKKWATETNRAIFNVWKQNINDNKTFQYSSNDLSASDPARSIYYESTRAGIDPNMGAALVLYFGSTGRSILPVSNATLDALKMAIAQSKDQFCWNPFAFRTNMRIALNILKGYEDNRKSDMTNSLAKYLAIDAEFHPRSITGISKEITVLYERMSSQWPRENF